MNVYMKEKTRVFCQNSFDDLDDNIGIVMPILTECDVDEDFTEGIEKVGDTIPILPLRNMVLFPGVAMPVIIGRPKSMRLIKEAVHKKSLIGVVCQKEMDTEDPVLEDLYTTGVIADIVRVLEMPDGSTTVILQGKKRFELNELTETDPYLSGKITVLEDTKPDKTDREFEALISTIKDLTIKMLGAVAEPPRDLIFSIKNNKNVLYVVNFSCSNIPSGSAEKQQLLLIGDLKERAYRLLFILNREYQLVELKASIQMKTHEDINQQQKEYFLQQQIKTIQEELGGNINELEIKELREKASRKKWPAEVAQVFEKELRKLERLHPQSPDYSVQTQYVQNIVNLPWNEYSKDNFNLSHAQKVLDRDHYGLEKVKERIIEHLAVLKLKGDMKSPIICLYGPPGVGKTSLGRSIAEALRRKYVRVSLGGLHDEAEIRGHRRTYIGAMCGRIIQNIQKAGTSNPVFILDEIDKITNDFKGDPASALLEVLDPEQNNAFHDNYLDIDYDLSKVMFIATANNLNTISQPLLDRMELIEVSSYTENEKFHIAKEHLLPKVKEKNGLKPEQLKISDRALQKIISGYTREAGVRNLERRLSEIARKSAREVYESEVKCVKVTGQNVEKYLGKEKYTFDQKNENDEVGIVRGLAWTSVGGDTLEIEVNVMPGKGEVQLTGQLGDVMKESAQAGLSYIRSVGEEYHIPKKFFQENDIHIHIPEGAVPKDGPSAGITMATAMLSAITQTPVRADVAMTGEITLRGRVLPIGGLKEKILAAKNAGIKTICIPKKNEKDVEEISAEIKKGLELVFVEKMQEVLEVAFVKRRKTW